MFYNTISNYFSFDGQFFKSFLPLMFRPDFRQKIAYSWPQSINDNEARADWGSGHQYDLAQMTEIMLENLRDADK